MTTTVRAVYQDGVLRPEQPLPLAEGEAVEITLNRATPADPLLTQEEAIRRIHEAKTLEEMFSAAEVAAQFEPDDGYDLFEALNENRRRNGERLLFPPEEKGVSW